jgi:hypothetical protein
MKTILFSVAAVAGLLAIAVVGLLAIFKVGLMLFPWSYSPHVAARQFTLAEKNQRLGERLAPMPPGKTEATQSRDREVEALIARVQALEARIAELERQLETQDSMSRDIRQDCSGIRLRAKALPMRSRYSFLSAYNCATEQEQLDNMQRRLGSVEGLLQYHQ